MRALQQCAKDNAHVIPDPARAEAASKTIHTSFYVEDLLASVDSAEEAVELADDVMHILEEGKMHLRKWNSNNIEALTAITGQSQSAEEISLGDSTTVLGLHWDSFRDELFYKVREQLAPGPATKRIISSDMGHLYDPVGNLAPVMVVAKSIMQRTWANPGESWDAPVSEQLGKEWEIFRNALPQLERIRIPR